MRSKSAPRTRRKDGYGLCIIRPCNKPPIVCVVAGPRRKLPRSWLTNGRAEGERAANQRSLAREGLPAKTGIILCASAPPWFAFPRPSGSKKHRQMRRKARASQTPKGRALDC